MHEFGYTFDDIRQLSMAELTFLLEGLKKYYKERAAARRRRR